MKSLIIYKSIHHKNTQKIAKAMANAIQSDLVCVDGLDKSILSDYKLIGFGSGIYFGKHHKDLLKLADNISGNNKVFIFSTSGLNNKGNFFNNIRLGAFHFHNHLKKKLSDKGFKVVGKFNCPGFDTAGPFKFLGGISKGRPNNKDIKRAEDFALSLI